MKILGITVVAVLLVATIAPTTLTRDLAARLILSIGIYYAATAGRE